MYGRYSAVLARHPPHRAGLHATSKYRASGRHAVAARRVAAERRQSRCKFHTIKLARKPNDFTGGKHGKEAVSAFQCRKFALSFPHGNFKLGVTFNYVQLGEFLCKSLPRKLPGRPASQAGRGLETSRSFSAKDLPAFPCAGNGRAVYGKNLQKSPVQDRRSFVYIISHCVRDFRLSVQHRAAQA